MKTVDAIAHGRANNFDVIRFVAASSVIYSHAFPLASSVAPLSVFPDYDLGRMAVTVFFAISGLLIAKSFLRTPSLIDFIVARTARLFPGLIVALVLTALVLGPIVTTLPVSDYVGRKGVWGYIAYNASLYDLRLFLPGVFEHNPYPQVVNGSIWTLPWEVACYGGVVGAGLVSLLCKRRFWLALSLYATCYVWFRGAWSGPQPVWEQLSLPFVAGAAFYIFRRSVPLSGQLLGLLAGLTWAAWDSPVAHETLILSISYGTFVVAAMPVPRLSDFATHGDFSYGIYIYGFEVEQTVIHYWPGLGGNGLAVVAFALTLMLAAASWHAVEKPALDRRHAIGRKLASFIGSVRALRTVTPQPN